MRKTFRGLIFALFLTFSCVAFAATPEQIEAMKVFTPATSPVQEHVPKQPPTKPIQPDLRVPSDVARIVTWTHLCEKWMSVLNQNGAGTQNQIDTTPALNWAQSNCSQEELETRIARLHRKYKDDAFIMYLIDETMGLYKD